MSADVSTSKAKLMLQLLFTRPVEFWDRALSSIEQRLESPKPGGAHSSTDSYLPLSRALGMSLDNFFAEDALIESEAKITKTLEQLGPSAPFNMALSADFRLARFCYAVCRATKPQTVVETGVAYGVTTFCILKALELNGSGELHSIDLPPFAALARKFQGIVVPPSLRARWRLYCGSSRRVLPRLLNQLPNGVDIFIHDSLHTHRNMFREYRAVWPTLKGILISDDVGLNSAFTDFAGSVQPKACFHMKEEAKDSIFGVMLKT
jgi:hypothetical protein